MGVGSDGGDRHAATWQEKEHLWVMLETEQAPSELAPYLATDVRNRIDVELLKKQSTMGKGAMQHIRKSHKTKVPIKM